MGIFLFQIDLDACIISPRVALKTGRQTHFYMSGDIKYVAAKNIMDNKVVFTLSEGSDEDVLPRVSTRSNHISLSE